MHRLETADADKETKKKASRILQRQALSFYGGAEGTRTLYLIHAMDALSQVSYNPVLRFESA